MQAVSVVNLFNTAQYSIVWLSPFDIPLLATSRGCLCIEHRFCRPVQGLITVYSYYRGARDLDRLNHISNVPGIVPVGKEHCGLSGPLTRAAIQTLSSTRVRLLTSFTSSLNRFRHPTSHAGMDMEFCCI